MNPDISAVLNDEAFLFILSVKLGRYAVIVFAVSIGFSFGVGVGFGVCVAAAFLFISASSVGFMFEYCWFVSSFVDESFSCVVSCGVCCVFIGCVVDPSVIVFESV